VKDASHDRGSGYSGSAIDYMIKLEDALDFKCEVIPYMPPPKESYKGFTGFAYYMRDCALANGSSFRCKCDMGIGGWASTRERQRLVDFVHPFDTDAYWAVVRTSTVKDRSKTKGFFFLSVFSLEVWVSIAGTMLLIAVLYICDPHSNTSRGLQNMPEPQLARGFDDTGEGGSGGSTNLKQLGDLIGTLFFRLVSLHVA
jgi:hypothetical protein